MKRAARWAGWSLLVIAATGVAAWMYHRTPWRAPMSVFGVFVMVAPLAAGWVWLVYNRGTIMGWVDENTDVADRALVQATDARDEAHTALVSVQELWDWLNEAANRPHSPLSAPAPVDPGAQTNPVSLKALKPAEGETIPRPAIDVAYGARRPSGATASGHGRHAAPDSEGQVGT